MVYYYESKIVWTTVKVLQKNNVCEAMAAQDMLFHKK